MKLLTEPLARCPSCQGEARTIVVCLKCGACGRLLPLAPEEPEAVAAETPARETSPSPEPTAFAQMARQWQSDAPACPQCGCIAVRNGACYKCLNCGESLGCS